MNAWIIVGIVVALLLLGLSLSLRIVQQHQQHARLGDLLPRRGSHVRRRRTQSAQLDRLIREHSQQLRIAVSAEALTFDFGDVVGMLNAFAALASATTLFFKVWRSIDCTPIAICG